MRLREERDIRPFNEFVDIGGFDDVTFGVRGEQRLRASSGNRNVPIELAPANDNLLGSVLARRVGDNQIAEPGKWFVYGGVTAGPM